MTLYCFSSISPCLSTFTYAVEQWTNDWKLWIGNRKISDWLLPVYLPDFMKCLNLKITHIQVGHSFAHSDHSRNSFHVEFNSIPKCIVEAYSCGTVKNNRCLQISNSSFFQSEYVYSRNAPNLLKHPFEILFVQSHIIHWDIALNGNDLAEGFGALRANAVEHHSLNIFLFYC